MYPWWLLSEKYWIEFLQANSIDLNHYGIDQDDLNRENLFTAIEILLNSGDFVTTLQYDLLLIALQVKDQREEIRRIYRWSRDERNVIKLKENSGDTIYILGKEATHRYMNIQRKIILNTPVGKEEVKSVEAARTHLQDYHDVADLIGLYEHHIQYLPMIYRYIEGTSFTEPAMNGKTFKFYNLYLSWRIYEDYVDRFENNDKLRYPVYLTFNQCKNIGGHIRRGSKAGKFGYFYYNIRNRSNPFTREDMPSLNDEELSNVNKIFIPEYKTINLFHISQCRLDEDTIENIRSKLHRFIDNSIVIPNL